MFNVSEIRSTAAAVIGSTLLSAICLLGAVGPAKAAVFEATKAAQSSSNTADGSSKKIVRAARPILM